MARPHGFLVKTLLLYVVLLPTLGSAAAAQSARPAEPHSVLDPPRPFDPPGPPPGDGVRFVPTARPMTVRATNGFDTDATTGVFRHGRHHHDGGVITTRSPWGETLETRFWLTPHGVSFEYDGDLVVRYRFDRDGVLEEIHAESPAGEARMRVGNRAQLVQQGRLDFASLDLSAYEVIEEAFRGKHSDAFIDGLAEAQGVVEASCGLSIIQCAACIIGWAATVPALAAACIVGGIPTFGLACFAAILAHEASTFACAATCVAMIGECRGEPQGEVIPDGCEPRE